MAPARCCDICALVLLLQVDPEQAALAALKREVKLLRSENAVLRDTVEQLLQEQRASGAAMPAGLAQSQGQPPGTPSTASYAVLPPGSASFAVPGTGQGAGSASAGSRPATGPSAAASAGSLTPSPEDLMRRLLDTQRMLVQFSRENDRLASENGRLRTGKTLVANDYAGALRVGWLTVLEVWAMLMHGHTCLPCSRHAHTGCLVPL